MIQDFKFTLNDFELNYDVLKSSFKTESEEIRALFNKNINEPPNLYEYLLFIRSSNDEKHINLKNNTNNYQIFFLDVVASTHLHQDVLNHKVNEILTKYRQEINFIENIHEPTIAMILMQPLIQNHFKYLNNREFNYNEFDLYKRLCVLDSLRLIKNHNFLITLKKRLENEYGIYIITKKDRDSYNTDVMARIAA